MNRMLDVLMRVTRQPAKRIVGNLLAVIGGAVTLASFVSLLTSKPMRVWVVRHPYYTFSALIVSIFALLIVLNYAQELRARTALANSAPAAEPPKPTAHDCALFRDLVAILPPDGAIMEWLKGGFDSLKLPNAPLQALDQTGLKITLDAVGFDDHSANAGYRDLGISIKSFCKIVKKSARLDTTETYLEIPQWWEKDRRTLYETEIQAAHGRLTSAYDGCLRACHSAGMDA